MAKKKRHDSQAQQSKRFVDMARELEVDETEAGQEHAFGKVRFKKPKKSLRKR